MKARTKSAARSPATVATIFKGLQPPTLATLPVPQELPCFLLERDRMAKAAGLQVERAWADRRRYELITQYSGSYQALIASPFIVDPEGLKVPTNPSHGVKRGVWDPPTPFGAGLKGAFRRENGLFYVKFADRWPLEHGRLENGTDFYAYDEWDCHGTASIVVYIGTGEALLNDAVATREQLPFTPEQERSWKASDIVPWIGHEETIQGRRYRIWESEPFPGGRVKHQKYVRRSQEARVAKEAERRGSKVYLTAEDFRQDIAEYADLLLILMKTAAAKPQGGPVQYFFDDTTVERLEAMASDLRDTIACAPVRSRSNAPRLQLVSSGEPSVHALRAATDAKFQGFLRSALPPKPSA